MSRGNQLARKERHENTLSSTPRMCSHVKNTFLRAFDFYYTVKVSVAVVHCSVKGTLL